MIIKSTPINPKRNRVTVHSQGVMFPLANAASAVLEFTTNPLRIVYVEFDVRDLPCLKKVIKDLEKEKKAK